MLSEVSLEASESVKEKQERNNSKVIEAIQGAMSRTSAALAEAHENEMAEAEIEEEKQGEDEHEGELRRDDYDMPYKYIGERDNHYRRHGYGTLFYPNGDMYEGQWQKGLRSGFGKYSYTDGSYYEGDWDEGFRVGEGCMKYTDGSVYEGEWFLDRRHGWGKCEFSNGDLYEGQFVSGIMNSWRGIYSFNKPPHLYYVGPIKNHDISWSDCALLGSGKLLGVPGSRSVVERNVYFDQSRPYSAERAVDEYNCPKSEEEDDSTATEEVVTSWSDLQ